ncbi:Putative formate dehydrogenase oxidoreductase protein [Nocardioides sp. AX2bis]|nr:Putative formate dehydrogenase oxidoreductase protein [Nocardioides sp. AX2bis]
MVSALRPAPKSDIDEGDLDVDKPHHHAAGPTAVAVSMKRAMEQMGPVRTAQTLLKLNQADGFDCQGCAWPDPSPGERHHAEFCENGAKAVTEEATKRRVDREFFASHSLADLAGRTEYWLGQQGRITEPMIVREGGTHYEPISWEDANALMAERLTGLSSPDRAVFYTSGKVSNEAAYAYQVFVRALGTNNLPDCSNMCHESSGSALVETIGIGKGSVSLEDIHLAKLIVVVGQNPGTNHPRMLSALEEAKGRGAKIISVNPLEEAGMVRFKNPQKVKGWLANGTGLSDLHLPIRINGDLALFQAIGSLLVQWDALDREFLERYTAGFEQYVDHVQELDWAKVEASTGLTRAQVTEAAEMFRDSEATVTCWAMGITQHHNSVATIKEIVNVALLQGNIGRPGAGLCPVRGHSNVQGDRTMGVWERLPDHFLDAIQGEFGFDPPREHGHDTVQAIREMRDGTVDFFLSMGGNFVSAAPDTEVTAAAMRKVRTVVNVATKLNHSHVTFGRETLLLPPLGRSEKDLTGGVEQRVTVEDSMSAVHASKGPLKPASPHLRSEVHVVCGLAEAVQAAAPDSPAGQAMARVPWAAWRSDYTEIRRSIARVVPGCAAYDEKVDVPGGFVLPHPPRDTRTFETESGKALLSCTPVEVLEVPQGRLLLQTLRSHDQFNTTIYGLDDRYRGISNGRRVVFVHPDDIRELEMADGDMVDLVGEWTDPDGNGDAEERIARDFRIVSYDQPRGCAAAYYPETNPLVPLDSTAVGSNTPVSKAVILRLERPGYVLGSRTIEGSGDQGTGTMRTDNPGQLA